LKFSEYFNEWLYGENGYYRGVGQVGKKGDFLTSPSVSMFFAGALANKFVSLVMEGKLSKDAIICEFGANSLFAVKDFASFLAGLAPDLLKTVKFVIVEKQFEAAEFQKKELAKVFGDIRFDVVESLAGYEECEAFVYANEIFDSFGCELIMNGKTAIVESHKIEFAGNDNDVLTKAARLGIQKGELSIGYEEFASMLYGSFKKSYFVTFDYGQEYPRNDFSIRVYKEHNTQPLFGIDDLTHYFGSCDITYDVNFSHLREAFEGAGFDCLEYKNQSSALIDFGITDLLELYLQKADEEAYLKEAAKVKMLIAPNGFGERFKMISFKKGV
jgi:SAM-dependent MidA family methyltransferase